MMMNAQAQLEFLKKAIDSAFAGVWICDHDGITVYINDRMLELLDRTRSEVMGRTFLDFIPAEFRADAEDRFANRARGEKEQYESSYIKKNGELVHAAVLANPVFENDKMVGVVAVISDITERKKAENELSRLSRDLERMVREREADLRRTQRELQSFFESSPLMMGIIELVEGRVRHVIDNPAFCKAMGLKRGETSGKYTEDFGPTTENQTLLLRACDRALKQRKPVSDGFVIGEFHYAFHMNYIGLSPEGHPRFSYVIEDVTEKKQLERKKDENTTRIAHMSKMSALGEMAGGIAHEVYNPLTIIRGYAELISRKTQDRNVDPKELQGLAQEIKETCNRITSIVEGLRFFAREGSRDPMDQVFVQQLVESTTKICSERLKRQGILLEVSHQDPLSKVFCRGVQISQVILNLLNNSFDAVKNQELKKISVRTWSDGETIFIEVEDSGEGIPKEIQNRIFEPFFTTKPVGLGTGMGLSICKGIMDAHSGSIKLNSSSQGTCFQLALPHGTRIS